MSIHLLQVPLSCLTEDGEMSLGPLFNSMLRLFGMGTYLHTKEIRNHGDCQLCLDLGRAHYDLL